MRSVEFQKFIDLVTFDQNLVKIEQDIKKSKEIKIALLADIERLQADFLDVKTAKLQVRKAVDEKELYMKVLDDKEAELKRKLQSVHNQKEYKSLEKETLAVNAQRIIHEQDLVGLWNKLESFEKTYDAKHKLHDEQVAKLTVEVENVGHAIVKLEYELQVLMGERITKEHGVPQAWLDMYVNMKGRVSNPVIPVVHDSCDACFYSVTPRDMQMLKNNKLLQCRDCYRLLYIQ